MNRRKHEDFESTREKFLLPMAVERKLAREKRRNRAKARRSDHHWHHVSEEE